MARMLAMQEALALSPELESPYETAARKLDALVAWAAENDEGAGRNEATTRLQLIDRLLEEALAWPPERISAEEAYGRTYVDYLLKGTGTQLLVEAKREGVSFDLPPGFESRTLSLPILREVGPDVWAAVEQALNYCLSRGIPLGAVSNGNQMIGFIGSRQDGVPPAEGRAVVFSSLEDIRAGFSDFWRYFSAAGIEGQYLYAHLQRASQPPPPPKLASTLFRYPGTKNRNQIQAELQILGELFLVDVLENPVLERSFLEDAYCTSGALSQYSLVSREILQTRYDAFLEELGDVSGQPVATKRGIAAELTADVLTASLSNRPIILLGDVGVGKTTFIRRLIQVDARDLFDDAFSLYVDFGRQPALATEIEAFVRDVFVAQLRENFDLDIYERQFVRAVYNGDINRFSKGIYADLADLDPGEYKRRELEMLEAKISNTEGHLRASLRHLVASQRRQIVIFLDNVDQRPFRFQEQVFLLAQSLAAHWLGTVFVSLRPETFYRSRVGGSLAAYQPRVFTIAPPRIDDVLRRRLEFAQKRLLSSGSLESLGSGVTVQSEKLEAYVRAILYSLARNVSLIELIDNLSAGNVRRAVDFLVAFVGSGHVDSEKIVSIVQKTGRYTIPVHEFLRAIVFGDHEHYEPTASPIANVFDLSMPDAREHLLLSSLLAFVERTGEISGSDGYVSVAAIFAECHRLGLMPSQADQALTRAREKNLLESNLRGVMYGEPDSYRITPTGAYTYKRLVKLFTYVDAMIIDTPVVDTTVRQLIKDVRGIGDRLARCDNFRRYLDSSYAPLADLKPAFEWKESSRDLEADVENIALRL